MRHRPTVSPARFRTSAFAFLVLLCLGTGVSAQTAAPGDSWQWARFDVRDGLPSDVLLDVAESGDTLWALTGVGIAWFDAFQWHAVSMPAEFRGRITQLAVGPGGRIYCVAAGRLMVVDKTGATVTTAAADSGDHYFEAVASAGRGPLLVSGRDGVLYEWDGTRLRPHAAAREFGYVRSLVPAGRNGAWISTTRGLFCWDGEVWRQRLAVKGPPYVLSSAIELPDERAWAYVAAPASAKGLWTWQKGPKPDPRLESPSVVVSLAVDFRNNLYAAHSSGELSVLRKDTWVPLTNRFPEIADVRRIGIRANRDFWVASDHGLFLSRQSSARWSFLSFPPADGRNAINEIFRGQDGLWLATGGGLLRVQRNNAIERIERAGGEPIGSVTGLMRDGAGRLWISSGGAFTGVRWLDRDGWHRLQSDDLLDRSFIHKVVADRSGGVWFLGLNTLPAAGRTESEGPPGAFRLGPDGRVVRWGKDEGLPNYSVYAFAEGPDGAYWFGTTAGVSRWKSGQWRHWTRKDGLGYGKVFALTVDPSGAVWFGHQSGNGLGRLSDGALHYFTSRDGLASDDVWGVAVDGKGRVWVSCTGGLSVLQDGNWTTFDHTAGLRSTRVWPVLPAGEHLYVGTNGGGLAILSLVKPSPPPIVLVEPPVLEASGAQVAWRAFAFWGELESAAVPTRIQVDGAPWSAWTLDRTRYLNRLGPGSHTVSIQAKSLLGDLSAVASETFAIAPPLVLRPGFYVPVGGLLVALSGLLAFTVIRQRRHNREMRDREAQLRHAHKMESVGRLAGAIAHDFNNLLTVISGNAAILEDEISPDDPRRQDVGQIRVAAERAERLTRQLLTFARKQVQAPRPVNLAALLLKTGTMLRRLIGEQIELATVVAPDVAPVFVDPGQIEQVLMNLAVNARDAMPGGGTLTLRATNLEIREDDPRREPDTAPGAYVRLSVIDTGTGIDPETAARVFDPFFTTKQSGTGLGLATCYGIIKQAKGQITIETAMGRGTSFHVDLPVSSAPAPDEEPVAIPADASTGSETVLLVEDEVQVRQLAATALRQRGYTVIEAGDGAEALRLDAASRTPIHILVTDVVMPIMRGTELAGHFLERRPDAKVLFMSGFIDDDAFRQEMGERPRAFIAKPFSLADFTRTVRDVLDGKPLAT